MQQTRSLVVGDEPQARLTAAAPRDAKPSIADFVWHIAARDLRVSFRVSTIATIRSLIQPLGQTVIFWLLFSQIVRSGFGRTSGGYPLFALAGLLSWSYFSTIVGGAAGSLTRNALLIRRVALPREALVYASLAQPLLQLLVTSIVLSVLLVARRGLPARPQLLLWLLPIFLIVTAMAIGIGLAVSAGCAVGREGQSLVPLAMQLWFFFTPIIYPPSSAPAWLARTFPWNPMAIVVTSLRRVLLAGASPEVVPIAFTAAVAIALLVGGRALFRLVEHVLPEVL